MRTTTKQRRAIQEAAWCEQYRKTNWAGGAANEYFARHFQQTPVPATSTNLNTWLLIV